MFCFVQSWEIHTYTHTQSFWLYLNPLCLPILDGNYVNLVDAKCQLDLVICSNLYYYKLTFLNNFEESFLILQLLGLYKQNKIHLQRRLILSWCTQTTHLVGGLPWIMFSFSSSSSSFFSLTSLSSSLSSSSFLPLSHLSTLSVVYWSFNIIHHVAPGPVVVPCDRPGGRPGVLVLSLRPPHPATPPADTSYCGLPDVQCGQKVKHCPLSSILSLSID